jgi:anti-anti-sigma factor
LLTRPASALVTVRGDLDLATTPGLCREIECATAEPRRIVVDLRGVTLCDTSSVRALIGAAHEATIRTCELVLVVEPQSAGARLLDASGAREHLRVESTVRRALEAFG